MFTKGQSGNPGGRPKLTTSVRKVQDIARDKSEMAINVLCEIANNESYTPSARVSAASAILDRGWVQHALILYTFYLLCFVFSNSAFCNELSKPNFIVLLTEAQGWSNTSIPMDDLNSSSKSKLFKTPAVERLALEGMRFTFGYAASPRCTPSRAALFTGKSPAFLHMTFINGNRENGFSRTGSKLIPPEPLLELPRSEKTIADILKTAGYGTAHFGKWHVGRVDPSQHGFDDSDGPTSNGGPDNVANPNPKEAYAMTSHGIQFMEKMVNQHKPFYLQLSHYPNQGQKNRDSLNSQIHDSADVDATVMQVLDAVDRLGIKDTTYIIYTSDHGSQGRNGNEPLSGGKGFVLEGGLRVPFIIRGPGIKPNLVSHVPVTAMDILPTLHELAHIPSALPSGVEGGSLVSLLKDPTGMHPVTRSRQALVFHFPHYDHGNFGPATAIISDPYKLIKAYETNHLWLYNIREDPSEKKDLTRLMPDKVKELTEQLSRYLKNVNAQFATVNPEYDPTKPPEEDAIQQGAGKRHRKNN